MDFNNNEDQSSEILFTPGTPTIVRWTVKYSGGIIKNEKQANYALMGVSLVMIIIAISLVYKSFSGGNKVQIPPDFEVAVPTEE